MHFCVSRSIHSTPRSGIAIAFMAFGNMDLRSGLYFKREHLSGFISGNLPCLDPGRFRSGCGALF